MRDLPNPFSFKVCQSSPNLFSTGILHPFAVQASVQSVLCLTDKYSVIQHYIQIHFLQFLHRAFFLHLIPPMAGPPPQIPLVVASPRLNSYVWTNLHCATLHAEAVVSHHSISMEQSCFSCLSALCSPMSNDSENCVFLRTQATRAKVIERAYRYVHPP